MYRAYEFLVLSKKVQQCSQVDRHWKWSLCMPGIFYSELGEAIGWNRWDNVCSGKQQELESSPVVLTGSKTREWSGALTSTEDNVTACKTAAYALALLATQRKIQTEVIVPSKFQVFIIYSSECSTTTKFTWLSPCSYKPQSLREKGAWGSFANLEVGGGGFNEFPKTCCTMVRKAYRDFGHACWTLKKALQGLYNFLEFTRIWGPIIWPLFYMLWADEDLFPWSLWKQLRE